ncbi:MAG: hypothetical protein ACYCTW_04205 [Sulfuricella sp.]
MSKIAPNSLTFAAQSIVKVSHSPTSSTEVYMVERGIYPADWAGGDEDVLEYKN